jgi:hypothetical protein
MVQFVGNDRIDNLLPRFAFYAVRIVFHAIIQLDGYGLGAVNFFTAPKLNPNWTNKKIYVRILFCQYIH